MNLKNFYSLNNLKTFENAINGNSLNSTPSVMDAPVGIDLLTENRFKLQLQTMEEHNRYLEKLLEQRTKKLAEVVASNTKFLCIIGHDLKSPFAAILFALDLLKGEINNLNKNEVDNYVKIASDSANKALSLLESLLAWAITQNQGRNFNPIKLNLRDLLQSDIEGFTISAKNKHIALNNFIPTYFDVNGDMQMLKTIFRNLISNAIKYTNTHGEITISALQNARFIEISVHDNGIGMTHDAQKKLFKADSFFSTVGTNKEKGTGLGLLLCKEFVEMHGGYIRIESEPNIGSRFIFALPN